MKDPANRKLLIAFLLGAALCAVVWCVDISMLLFATVVPFFCLQLLLLRLTKKPFLRLIPVYPVVLMLLGAGYYWLFGSGWDGLAALILGFASIAPIVGCLFALLVFRFSGKFLTQKWLVASLVILGCAGAWMGQEISLGYWNRALIKALSFGCCMGLYWLVAGKPVIPSRCADWCGNPSPSSQENGFPEGELSQRDKRNRPGVRRCEHRRGMTTMFQKPDASSFKVSAALALAVFLFLTVGYMVLSPCLDLSAIPEKLRYSDITADTFPAVAAYIILCNALLEEIFFRGFAFLIMRKYASERFAYLFSGAAFALYHVSIMDGWFHPIWFGLFIAGLAVAGMLFDLLDRRGSIWNGWLVHAAANLAINLIGMRMFGIL